VFKKKLLLIFSLVLILGLFLVSFAYADSKSNGRGVKAGTGWEQFQKDILNSGQTESPSPTSQHRPGLAPTGSGGQPPRPYGRGKRYSPDS